MIRKLCWQVSDAWDDHQLQSSKQAPVLCNVWRVATPLSLVSEIVFEFNEKHSSMTNIPMPHEVAGYVDTPNVHTLHMLKRSRLVDDAAQFYCEAALALQALADFNYFPNVRDIRVNGVVMRPKRTIQWEGLDLNRFDKESPFMRRFSARVRAHGKHFIFDKPKRITTLCQRCGAQWDPDHWSEDNEDLICPGFADDELGGEIAIYSVDDWIEAEDDEPSEYGGPESYNDWEYEY
ncbi:hypothetical protein B0A55_08912 [Friedmanniomyces simplex]|uniref:Uncharacterized protein n=1 Tax=Friedmanniomyces simplex TaxID=329884 RepID=A0A4V5NEU3_9PEZI|nr:hypothetical protein B0A55_08912 [Friedmanniomyces simplex]